MIHEVLASSPDFARLTELRDFQFGQSVERRVEVYARRSPSRYLILNIDRTGQVTSSGQVTSTRADFILTVWLGSNDTGRQTLHGSIRPNDEDPDVLIRHAERRQGDSRAQFVRKFLSGLSKEIRAQAEEQLNSSFEGEVIA